MSPEVSARRDAVAQLCRRHHVQRLELFGSGATRAELAAGSDLDFLVEFDPLPSGAYADAFFGLREDLEALFDRSIDLVVASSVQNPYFQQSIDESRTLLYAA